MEPATHVPLRRGRLRWMLTGVLVLALVFACAALIGFVLFGFDAMPLACLVLALVFAGPAWPFARRLRREGPGLVADDHGITNASTLDEPRFVSWHDMLGLELERREVQGTEHVLIVLRLRGNDAVERINANLLQADPVQLLAHLRELWARHAGL